MHMCTQVPQAWPWTKDRKPGRGGAEGWRTWASRTPPHLISALPRASLRAQGLLLQDSRAWEMPHQAGRSGRDGSYVASRASTLGGTEAPEAAEFYYWAATSDQGRTLNCTELQFSHL